jgi:hypothetical protein
VTLEGVREHQAQFQKIAANDDDPFYPGDPSCGHPGLRDSVDYVAGLLKDAGYQVTLDSFEFQFQFQFPALLQQLTPVNTVYETGAFTDSGSGDVTGNVIAVYINLTGDRASTSGCEAADFTGLDFSGPSDIALIQRGTCTFADKALNAQAAGAEAVPLGDAHDRGNRETAESQGADDAIDSGEPDEPGGRARYRRAASLGCHAPHGHAASLSLLFIPICRAGRRRRIHLQASFSAGPVPDGGPRGPVNLAPGLTAWSSGAWRAFRRA